MTASHLYRMYVEYLTGVFDFTGTQMVITMKLTSFAYNLYDGTADHHNVFKLHSHDNKAMAKIYTERKKFAITSLPNLLEYFGYIYCFTCLLAGPAFEYQDYIRSIDGRVFEHPTKGEEDDTKKISPPSSLVPGLIKFIQGTAFLIGHVLLNGQYPLSNLYNKEFIANNSFLWRCAYLYIALIGARFKFYFVWMLAEGSSNLAGFGFEGFSADGRALGWGGVNNVDILGFETASCLQHLSRAWNKRTQGWLERYTYQRTNRSLAITYFVSAIWHGLYPGESCLLFIISNLTKLMSCHVSGFFVFFMSMPLVSNVERLFKSKVTPRIAPDYDGFNAATYPKSFYPRVYWLSCCVVFMSLMNYLAQVFHFGSLERSIAGLGSYYYLGHICTIIAYIILSFVPSPYKASSAPKKKQN